MEHTLSYLVKALLAYITAALVNNFVPIVETYGLMLFIGISVMTIDFLSGMARAKINKEIDNKKGWIGFWKKVAYLIMMCFAIFIDFSLPIVAEKSGYPFEIAVPIGLFVIGYVYINESISIVDNLIECGIKVPERLKRTFKNVGDEK
jgi:toxin secretion/phage lysis holin